MRLLRALRAYRLNSLALAALLRADELGREVDREHARAGAYLQRAATVLRA